MFNQQLLTEHPIEAVHLYFTFSYHTEILISGVSQSQIMILMCFR